MFIVTCSDNKRTGDDKRAQVRVCTGFIFLSSLIFKSLVEQQVHSRCAAFTHALMIGAALLLCTCCMLRLTKIVKCT